MKSQLTKILTTLKMFLLVSLSIFIMVSCEKGYPNATLRVVNSESGLLYEASAIGKKGSPVDETPHLISRNDLKNIEIQVWGSQLKRKVARVILKMTPAYNTIAPKCCVEGGGSEMCIDATPLPGSQGLIGWQDPHSGEDLIILKKNLLNDYISKFTCCINTNNQLLVMIFDVWGEVYNTSELETVTPKIRLKVTVYPSDFPPALP